jgi:hypothetical protein
MNFRLRFSLFVCASGIAPVVGQSKGPAIISSQEEINSHRIGDPVFVRFDSSAKLAQSLPAWAVVHVRLGVRGSVLSANAEGDLDSKVRFKVEAALQATKYRPCEREGHPVDAEFDDLVALLPRERLRTRILPFPEIRDWNSVRIRLIRTRCYGMCPAYAIEIRGDGTVRFKGAAFVSVEEERVGSISQEAVKQLIADFRALDYYSLDTEYVAHVFDVPTVETYINIGGQTKQVKDHYGLWAGMPMGVVKLEDEIDEVAGTKKWIGTGSPSSR